ncbi:MAG: hypothetical protein B6229_01135 [Spirochaetaceae bacterium 4572_7]|nr:MAG: hypothetical protein B6229_01135 [Spirochaetaceae bacterium 4572_7]
MHNLFRKSLKKLVVGLFVLLLFNCKTSSVSFTTPPGRVGLEEVFSDSSDYLIYVDLDDNRELISEQIEDMTLSKNVKNFINNSYELYIGVGSSSEIILVGDFSKGLLDIGLFFSLDWKRESNNGVKYWHSRDGLNLYIRDSRTIVLSNNHITSTILKLGEKNLTPSSGSAHIIVPVVTEELLKSLTKGFMKSGIDSMEFITNRNDSIYTSTCIISLPTSGKAKTFSRVIELVLKLLVSGSTDYWIKDISDNIRIKVVEKDVLVENILIKDKNIVEMAKKLIIMNREADK